MTLQKAGDRAPDFALPDEQGKIHRPGDYRGKTVVLCFYPKDDTPGCTREACNLRDNFKQLTSRGIVILGVSYDSPQRHRRFREKHGLTYPLLSDENRKVAHAYGADGGLFGRFFPQRKTFVIDANGRIINVIYPVSVNRHAQQILEIIDSTK